MTIELTWTLAGIIDLNLDKVEDLLILPKIYILYTSDISYFHIQIWHFQLLF